MIKIKNPNLTAVFQYLILFVSAIYNFSLFSGTKLYGNAASRVLLALGPMLGIGSPYKDLYELVPPGYLMLVVGWVRAFGMSMDAFRLLQVFVVLINGWLLIKVLEKLFDIKLLRLFIFFTTIVTVHSWVIQTDFFSIDFFATTLVLGGLASLLHLKNKFLKVSLAATLFVLASQMKDIYALSVLSLAPYYLRELFAKDKKDLLRLLVQSALGPLMVLGSIAAYLQLNDSLAAYLNIIDDKTGFAQTQTFSLRLTYHSFKTMVAIVEENFSLAPQPLLGLFIINSIVFFALFKKQIQKTLQQVFKTIYSTDSDWRSLFRQFIKFLDGQLKNYGETSWGRILLTITVIVFVLFGLTIYGLYFGTQLIMIVTSYYLVVGILMIIPLRQLAEAKSWPLKVFLSLALLTIFVPKHIPRFFNFVPMHRDYTFAIEEDIIAKVGKDECILHVHGWEIAISYIYTQRRPCSKYFLSNELFNIKRPGVVEEYSQHLVDNPPAAFLYNEKGSDMDIEKFDNQIIDFNQVLDSCYQPDPKYTDYMKHFFAQMTLYWPREGLTPEELQKCWAEVVFSDKTL